MELTQAFEKFAQVLKEEKTRPTLLYHYVSDEWPSHRKWQQFTYEQKGFTPAMAAWDWLAEERKQRPRFVYEDPKLYTFQSTNFDLLLRIFSQVRPDDREKFIKGILEYVEKPIVSFGHRLLTEFLIRTGHLNELLAATAVPSFPVMSMAEVLNQIAEMIALNFNLFSDAELASFQVKLDHVRQIAERQTWQTKSTRGAAGADRVTNPYYKPGYSDAGNAILKAIDGI